MRTLLTLSALLLAGTAFAQTAGPEKAAAPAAKACGPMPIERCIAENPSAARTEIEARLKGSSDAYARRLLGDLYASDAPFADKNRARALYEEAYREGEIWAGVALAKLLAAEPGEAGKSRAITIFEDVSAKSDEAAKWALYEAGVLRLARGGAGDEAAAYSDHARAARLANPWSTVPLAHRLADGGAAPIEADELAGLMETALKQNDPLYLLHGRNALARLYLEVGPEGKRRRGLELLREVAERSDGEGQTARVSLARHLLDGGKASEVREATAILKREVAAGYGPAEFELGRHMAEADDEAQHDEAGRLLRSALAKDPSQAAYGYYLIGEMDWSATDPARRKRAVEAFEKAADAGSPWAEMRLSQAYASGAAGAKSTKLARAHGERAFESENPQAGVTALFALYDTPYDLPAADMVSYIRKGLAKASPQALSDAISWAPDNSKVRFAQALWNERDLYDGPVNGILNASTMKVFARECRRYQVQACRTGIMPKELLLALVTSLEPTS